LLRAKSIEPAWVSFSQTHLLYGSVVLIWRVHVEVIDLTHPANVSLLRLWDQTELPYIQLLRFVRISSSKPELAIVSRLGKHPDLAPPKAKELDKERTQKISTEEDEVPQLLPPAAAEEMNVDA
jgi:hypothetical protein